MKNTVSDIINILQKKYPNPETALNHNNVFELLIATILSAQTTDKQVNKITKKLFKKYNTPQQFVKLEPEDFSKEIKSIGLYHNKSKYIIKTSKMLLNKFEGRVPQTRKELLELPGVGRKTANVVLSCGFAQQAFPVDTHVLRVSNRLGMVNSENVEEVEKKLMHIIPNDKWSQMHHWLIFHGREVCKSQNPACSNCQLQTYCDYFSLQQ